MHNNYVAIIMHFQLQTFPALMVTFDWLALTKSGRVEWKYASTIATARCVMMGGIILMLE